MMELLTKPIIEFKKLSLNNSWVLGCCVPLQTLRKEVKILGYNYK